MKWEKLFENKILKRGYEYYKSGKVKIIDRDDYYVEAIVEGSEDYNVDIDFDDGDIGDMYCDCPYACDDENCKHMAAVLYALNDLTESTDTRGNDINTLVNEASPELLKEFLIKLMTRNEKLKYKFVRFLDSKSKKVNVSEYKKRFNDLIVQYSDDDDYIDYEYASYFFNEANDLLTECTDMLLAENRLYDTFDIVQYYYIKVSMTEVEDEEGDFYYFCDLCTDIFKKIITAAKIDEKRKMFDILLKMLESKNNDVFDMAFEFVGIGFNEEEFLVKLLDYTDKRIAKKDDAETKKHWISYRIKLMDKLNYSDDDMMDYSRKYPDIREIKDYLTDRFIEKGNNKAAIEILEDILKSSKNNIFDSERLHLKLKDLYKQTNDQEKYIRELWIILTEEYVKNTDIYREFKALFDADEWEEVRERLYSSMEKQLMLPEYFVEEKLYDRLASYVITNKSDYLIRKYEAYLAEDYSDFILSEYAQRLNKAAENTADRGTYSAWADKLIHMKTLKGGKECVSEIINNWRMLYRNRPAMMQELNRVEPKPAKSKIKK